METVTTVAEQELPETQADESFQLISKDIAICPKEQSWCRSYWPQAQHGTVYLYRFTEKFNQQTHERSAYIYKPVGLSSASPALVFLHGGTGSALDTVEKMPTLLQLADQRSQTTGISWRRNTNACKMNTSGQFQTATGQICIGYDAKFYNSQKFLPILPEGILSRGSTTSRHWEDGRVPSPGFDTANENRNDVAFIDVLIKTVKKEESALIDHRRLYVAGVSNGGMMTLRLACSVNEYKELSTIAAFSVFVAALPEPLVTGQEQRKQCAQQGNKIVPLSIFVGYGISQPNCSPFGCSTPTVSGDGRMPYGESGGTYYVNSPDSGSVVSALDTREVFVDYLTRSGAGVSSMNSNPLGYFTTVQSYSFTQSAAQIRVFDTQGGRHSLLSSRMDFNPLGQMWAFLTSYSLHEEGWDLVSSKHFVSGEF